MIEDQEVVREFILESVENLSRLDNEMVELEKRPADPQLLASIFRTFHTIKGTCGFLGFTKLEVLTHEAETLLCQLRSGEKTVTPDLVSMILEVVDATRVMLGAIESTGCEGDADYQDLAMRLRQAALADLIGRFAHSQPPAEPNGDSPTEQDSPVGPIAATAPTASQVPTATSPGIATAVEKPPTETASTETASTETASTETASGLAESAIRVDVTLLDKLMNLVGELVLARNQILQHQMNPDASTLKATSQRLNLITTELQEGVMKTRMQPIGVVWNKLPRVVRDLSASLGKQIRLEMHGAATELDKTIIEAIKDPLTHLVRNCCDHGIEPAEVRRQQGKSPEGRVTLRAWHEGGQVLIELADDGAGLNTEALKAKAVANGQLRPEQAHRMSDAEAAQLIFLPGLSTAQKISNVSGRGVGMDVVKCNIERIGGTVDVNSRTGHGACVRLRIPLTLAIIPGLVVALNEKRSSPRKSPGRGMSFVIPQVNLVELVRLEGDQRHTQIRHIHNSAVYQLRGELLPLVDLRETLRIPPTAEDSGVLNIVVVQADDRQFGLVVDSIRDTQEIVVKPLSHQLKGLNVYAGATIMGDGKVALILDVVGLGQRAGVLALSSHQASRESATTAAEDERQRLLLFEAGRYPRLAVPLSLVARLEEFPTTQLEQAGGRPVIQYRGGILPLVALGQVLDPASDYTFLHRESLPVIVFQNGQRSIGLIVDRILDIVMDTITIREPGAKPGLLGSAVVANRVVDLLDLHFVLQAVPTAAATGRSTHTVALADASPFARAILRTGMEMAGFPVIECDDPDSALAAIDAGRAHLVALSLDANATTDHTASAGNHPASSHAAWRNRTQAPPLLLLANTDAQRELWQPQRPGLEVCALKYDWQSMAESLRALTAATQTVGQLTQTPRS